MCIRHLSIVIIVLNEVLFEFFFFDRTAEGMTGKGGGRVGEPHAAKGCRLESNPWLLQIETEVAQTVL